MAIIAKDGFSQAELYYSVHNYTVHPKTKTVSARLNVFRDAAAAQAFKSAEAAIAAAQQTVKDTSAERVKVCDAYTAKPDAERVKGLKAFQEEIARLDAIINKTLADEKVQQSIRAASAPSPQLARDEHFPAGLVPVAESGAVLLADIYVALSKGALAGGTKA